MLVAVESRRDVNLIFNLLQLKQFSLQQNYVNTSTVCFNIVSIHSYDFFLHQSQSIGTNNISSFVLLDLFLSHGHESIMNLFPEIILLHVEYAILRT